MAITLNRLYTGTHQYNAGTVKIDIPFAGNILAIALTTKPEYASTTQNIGTLYQITGNAQKAYDLYSGQDVIRLELPETDKLWFVPTFYLSDNYTLTIDYASVGAVTATPNSVTIPLQILELPTKMGLIQTKLDDLGISDNSQSSRITALEIIPVTPLIWENIANKPVTFNPNSHSHTIGDVTDLQTTLDGKSNTGHAHTVSNISFLADTLSSLDTRIVTLETAPIAVSSGGANIAVSANRLLESNKSYVAVTSGLNLLLPSNPATGDKIELTTGNFDLKIEQNTNQVIQNLSTATTLGSAKGVILKPYSSICLVFIQAGLWISSFRSRIINNFEPISIEPNSVLKPYTPTLFGSANLAYSTTIANINNNQLAANDYINNGLLADIPTVRVLAQFTSPIRLDIFEFYSGQGNVGTGSANDGYKVSTINIYSGSDLSNLIGTFNPSNINGSKQTFTVNTSGFAYSAYIFEFTRIGNGIGILELDLFGRSQIGGEVIVI